MEKLEAEFGSAFPIRFSISSNESETAICLDCDAKSLAFSLESIEFDCPKLEKLREALLFVLWNTNWPVGD